MSLQIKRLSKIRILLADDHTVMRQGVRMLLEREPDFEVVAEAGDGEEAVRLTGEYLPDVVLMDVGMPKLSGLEATRQIKANHPATSVLVLTIHDDEEYIIRFLEAGAAGYLMKSAYGEELLQAIRSLRAGDLVLHPIVGQKLLKRASSRQLKPIKLVDVEQLTPRELEVLKLVARGISNQRIAIELGIGVRTVKGHLVNIFAKMEVTTRTEAIINALKRGWIVLEEIS
jgi:DNA-binding NarL/FixJ family response regulator